MDLLGAKLARAFGNIHGFFRTHEGRLALREAYKHYLADASNPKESKTASIVCGDIEYRKAKSALKRWREGQSELWVAQMDDTLAMTERLERHLMEYEAPRVFLDNQAVEIHKRDVGSSLAILAYGVNPRNPIEVEHLLSQSQGLFYVEEESWGSDRFNREYYVYYKRPTRDRYLIFHEFAKDRRIRSSIPILTYRKSGYAVPTPDRALLRFSADHSRPFVREFEVLSERGRRIDDEYRILYSRSRHYVDLNEDEDEWSDRNHRKLISYVPDIDPELVNYVESLLWDIVI